jgi:glycosyltransferase involved in cell wall biosynthesis
MLTLCMIVKNEEKNLAACLDSVKDVVDEIIIVDTGSTDSTIQIAEKYNAKIFQYEWTNNFSAARNFALGKSSGEWIFYMDADERLDRNSIAEFKKLSDANLLIGYYCAVKNYHLDRNRDNSIRYIRLFANSPEIKFIGRVHERLEPSLIQNRYQFLHSNILIHHIGYSNSQEDKQKKIERNLFLLKEEYESTKAPFSLFQIAQSYNILNDKLNAFKYYKSAGESVGLDRSLRAQCFASLAYIAYYDHKSIEAERYIQFSLKLDDRQPFSQLLSAKIALRKGDYLTAELRCRGAQQLNQNMILGKEQSKLAILLDPEEVICYGLTLALQNKNFTNISYYQNELTTYNNKMIDEKGPQKLTVIQKLFGNSMLTSNEEEMFIEMANHFTMNLFLYMLTSNPNKQQVFQLSNDLLKKYPNAVEIKKIIAKLLEDSGKIDEAILLLENIVESNQYDPTILFYLISFYLKKGAEEKIKPVIGKLEKNYSHIPEVMERVRKLRRKLLMLTTVPL